MSLKDMMLKSFITDILEGKEIDETGMDQWVKDLIPQAREIAKTAKLEEVKARIEKKVKKLGYTFEEWYHWAMSLYTVSETFTVKSNARDWKEEKIWETTCEADALEKVEQLVGYKIHDRARGRGDMDKDMKIS